MMEFTKHQIIDALDSIHNKRIVSNDDIIKAIRKNVLEGKIQQSDIQFIIDRIYPTVLDEKGLEINNFTLFDEEFLKEKAKSDAEKYLQSTDWIIAKIGEYQFLGNDVSEMLVKYKDVLDKREEARKLL